MKVYFCGKDEFMGLLSEPYGVAKKEALSKDEVLAIVQDLLALLADNFGEELDRMTLWTRIQSAVELGCAEFDASQDPESALNVMLDHVLASVARMREESVQRLASIISRTKDECAAEQVFRRLSEYKLIEIFNARKARKERQGEGM